MDKWLVLLLILTTTAILLVQSSNGQGCTLRVCYFNDDAQHRPTPGRFLPEDIDPTLCSHIIYNYVLAIGTGVVPSYKQATSAADFYERVIQLKNKKPTLKVLLALLGIIHYTVPIHHKYINEPLRSEFIGNIIKYLRRHKFDGLSINTKFTEHHTCDPDSKQSLSNWVAGLRQAFNKEATGSDRLMLTVSVYGERIIDDTCYDIPRISKNVDWIIFLAYDLHGDRYGTTGHHSPIYVDVSKGQRFSVDTAVTHWWDQGTPTQKMVIALPSFGRTFYLTGEQTGDGAISMTGRVGPYTAHSGMMAYYEICSFIEANRAVRYRLPYQLVPYLVSGKHWVGYDDVTSVIARVIYIKVHGLGGFALSYLDLDDFKGAFCGQGAYPLLRAANNECDE